MEDSAVRTATGDTQHPADSGADQAYSPADMVRMLSGFEISQALYVLAKLDIASVMHAGTRDVGGIAAAVGADEEILKRLLRTLTAVGVTEQRGETEFVVTDLGAMLARDTVGSLRELAIMLMETHYLPFHRLADTVRTGTPAATLHFGESFFDWLNADAERTNQFSAAMASMTDSVQGDVYSGYRLPDGDTVADVGGADGSVLMRLMHNEPNRNGIIFDLPAVVPTAHTRVAEHGFTERIDVLGGDFFSSVPTADVYLLSTVLHDWHDDSCTALLQRIAEAADPGARLVIVETIVPVSNEPHFSKSADLTMLGMVSGQERTRSEFAELLATAGFTLDRIVPTPDTSPYSIIEATLGSR